MAWPRKSAILLAVVLFPAALHFHQAKAQQPSAAAPGAQPVFRLNANLVLVDVVVTEKGNPVHGLDRGRFHIFESGKEQAIASFEEHLPGNAQPDFLAAQLPPNTYANIPAYPPQSAMNVLLLDALNTPMENQAQVRLKMIDYLGKVQPGTPMAVFTLSSRLRMVTGFTTDAAALVATLKSRKGTAQPSLLLNSQMTPDQLNAQIDAVSGATGSAQSLSAGDPSVTGGSSPSNRGVSSGPMSASEAMRQFEAETTSTLTRDRVIITLDAMQKLARYLAGIDGRKNVIWFSAAFPLVVLPNSNAGISQFVGVDSYQEQMKKTAALLTAARVAMYPVDARGLIVPGGFNASTTFQQPNDVLARQLADERESRDATFATMLELADETGGRAYINTNNLDKAVGSVVENGSSYYTVAYVPAASVHENEFRKIQIRMDDERGYKLAYRRGYYGKPPQTSAQSDRLAEATQFDAPQQSQLLFRARVLPAADPAFQGISLPAAPSGDKTAGLKGPAQKYIVDLTLDARSLVFEAESNGSHAARVEFAIAAYDSEGKLVNSLTHAYHVAVSEDRFAGTLASGVSIRAAIDVPGGQHSLRIAIRDLATDRCGSLEVPLSLSR